VGRDSFNAVGGFDEEYFWGYEDVDICLKLREAGKRIVYVPQAKSVHFESLTLGKHKLSSWFERNYSLYRRKWGHILSRMELAYVQDLMATGATRIGIFGTGMAGRGLYDVLTSGGFHVPFFVSGSAEAPRELMGRPVLRVSQIDGTGYDEIMVGSQFFFEIERTLPKSWMFPTVG
jgi:hypothetical protein